MAHADWGYSWWQTNIHWSSFDPASLQYTVDLAGSFDRIVKNGLRHGNVLGHFLKHFEVTVSESVMEEKTILLGAGVWNSDYMDNGNMLAERTGDLDIHR